jgi:hypothetical protein
VPVCISDQQARLHVAAETLALLVAVPLSVYFAARRDLPMWARIAAGAVAAGTLAVDGYLLRRYLRSGGVGTVAPRVYSCTSHAGGSVLLRC